MKKIIMVLILCLSLAGCSGGTEDGEKLHEGADSPEINILPAKVMVQWADGVLAEDGIYDVFTADMSENQTKVIFTLEGNISQFKVLALEFEGVDSDGNVLFSSEELYTKESPAERPLVVEMTFFGTLPNYGISYADEKGEVKEYAVEVSGKDGSLLLSEYTFYEKSNAVLEVPLRIYEPERQFTLDGYVDYGSIIEISQITGDDSDAVRQINSSLEEWYNSLYAAYVGNEDVWCEVMAWPVETGRYLSAVTNFCVCPDYASYGKVSSRVYDKLMRKEITLDDALAMTGVTPNDLLNDFRNWNAGAESDMTVTELDSLAFCMLHDGSVQFLAGVTREQEETGDRWTSFYTWTNGTILWYETVPLDVYDVKINLEDGILTCHKYFMPIYGDEN